MTPFQHFDDDDYTEGQRDAMIKVLRKYSEPVNRKTVIKKTKLNKQLRDVDTQVVALEKARLTDLYRQKEREWMDVANERAMYSTELTNRKFLEKHRISVEEYWAEKG